MSTEKQLHDNFVRPCNIREEIGYLVKDFIGFALILPLLSHIIAFFFLFWFFYSTYNNISLIKACLLEYSVSSSSSVSTSTSGARSRARRTF